VETIKRDSPYTPAQAAAVTGLPLPAVHKAIEYRLIRPRLVREGRSRYRRLSKSQVLYLQLEANGLRCLPLAKRRQVARAVEQAPSADMVLVTPGGVLAVEIKAARKQMEGGLRRLVQAERTIVSDPEIMKGTPVFRGTRIPARASTTRPGPFRSGRSARSAPNRPPRLMSPGPSASPEGLFRCGLRPCHLRQPQIRGRRP